MYKSIEAIEQLRNEKIQALKQVYTVKNANEVYRRQTALNSMAINAYTDVANVLMKTFPEDGVSKTVWAEISSGLGQLKFIGIPSEDELKKDYYKAMKDIKEEKQGYTIEPEKPINEKPKTNVQFKVKRIPLPVFIAAIALQGIAVPLVVKVAGVGIPALVRIIIDSTNALLMTVEVVMYIKFKKNQETRKEKIEKDLKRKAKDLIYRNNDNESNISENTNKKMEQWIAVSIKKVEQDNLKTLTDWFDNLRALTLQQIEKATAQE